MSFKFNPLTGNLDKVDPDTTNDYAQHITVAKSGGEFTSIQSAIDSITDNSVNKTYAINIYPGVYTEDIVMEDYVSLVGIGAPEDVVIYGTNSCPLIQFDSDDSVSALINLTCKIEPTSNAQCLIDITNGVKTLERCNFIVDSSSDNIEATLVSQTDGTVTSLLCRFTYTMSSTASNTKFHQLIRLAGSALYYIIRPNLTITFAPQGASIVVFISEADTATAESHIVGGYIDADFTHASFSGIVGVMYLHGTSEYKYLSNNKVTVTTAGSGTCYGMLMLTSAGGGVITTQSNTISITGFTNNYGAFVNSGDTINLNFDRLTAAQGTGGTGTINYVQSIVNGELAVSSKIGIGAPATTYPLEISGSDDDTCTIAIKSSLTGNNNYGKLQWLDGNGDKLSAVECDVIGGAPIIALQPDVENTPGNRIYYDTKGQLIMGGTFLNVPGSVGVLNALAVYQNAIHPLQNAVFDAGTKTITIAAGSWSTGFDAGLTFEVIGTVSNDGKYTIVSVVGTVLTTTEALVDETAPAASYACMYSPGFGAFSLGGVQLASMSRGFWKGMNLNPLFWAFGTTDEIVGTDVSIGGIDSGAAVVTELIGHRVDFTGMPVNVGVDIYAHFVKDITAGTNSNYAWYSNAGLSSYGDDIEFRDGTESLFFRGTTSGIQITSSAAGYLDLIAGTAIRIGDVSGGNYSEIEADGTLEFIGNATVWDDLRTPVSSVKVPAAKAPTWTAFSAGLVLAFADQAVAGNEEEVYFVMQIPHSYKEGTDITMHIHWSPSDNTAGTVRWGLEYEWVNIDGTYSSTTTIYCEDAVTNNQNDHLVCDWAAVSGSGKTISSMLVCRLFRNSSHANDTYTGDANLLEIDAHFEKDTIGSRQITTK